MMLPRIYQPDSWVILRMTYENETIYKVLAGWKGSYIHGDSWKLNSGITKIVEHEKYYEIHGYSGSCYNCGKQSERLSMMTQSVLNSLQAQLEEAKSDATIDEVEISSIIHLFSGEQQ